jgi:hypothetical protein
MALLTVRAIAGLVSSFLSGRICGEGRAVLLRRESRGSQAEGWATETVPAGGRRYKIKAATSGPSGSWAGFGLPFGKDLRASMA